jgi:hypothetical protein
MSAVLFRGAFPISAENEARGLLNIEIPDRTLMKPLLTLREGQSGVVEVPEHLIDQAFHERGRPHRFGMAGGGQNQANSQRKPEQ